MDCLLLQCCAFGTSSEVNGFCYVNSDLYHIIYIIFYAAIIGFVSHGGKGASRITNYGQIFNTVTDHDRKFLVKLRITDLILGDNGS